jgi:uncharacterized protein (TIGR02996 family)
VTEQDALLAAIFAAPDDDTPRLAYADWLDEHGEGVYAAFIRAQIARERLAEGAPDRDQVVRHEREVWKKLSRQWADLFGNWKPQRKHFRRGFHAGTFTNNASMSADDFAACSPRWWPWLPIRRVFLFTNDRFPETLLDCEYLRRLTRLRLYTMGHERSPTEEFVVRLFGSTRFERLADLEINPMALSRAVPTRCGSRRSWTTSADSAHGTIPSDTWAGFTSRPSRTAAATSCRRWTAGGSRPCSAKSSTLW